jgi:AcrR family transcriptional regulator
MIAVSGSVANPSEANASAAATRPGGRSARVRAAVHRAVRELLAEEPAEGLTLPVIAARAGVHSTTLYRRWGTVADLLTDVATSRFSGDIVVPDTGSLHDDLVRWTTDVATDLTDPDGLAIMRAAIGSGAGGSRACMADRLTQLGAIFDRERARDGTAPDPARAADALLGPLLFRAVFANDPSDPGWAKDLVESFLTCPGQAPVTAPVADVRMRITQP